jgi:hypothetical protein
MNNLLLYFLCMETGKKYNEEECCDCHDIAPYNLMYVDDNGLIRCNKCYWYNKKYEI